MTYLETLRERRTSSNATEQKLRLFIHLKDIDAILIVEGEEDSNLYADAFHKVINGKSIRIIICDGKGGVLGLRDFANENFPSDSKLIFFVDKDHDDFLGIDNRDERTYITDYYSVEWYVCTQNVLFSLVRTHYTLSDQDPIWAIVEEKFQELNDIWLCHCRPIMQAAVIARRKGEDLDLDQIPLSEICRFRAGTFQRTSKTLVDLLIKAGCSTLPSELEIAECSNELDSIDPQLYVRGKLVIQFFCEFFKKLDLICGNPTKIDGQILKTGVQLGKNSFFQFIISYWSVPNSLYTFLVRWDESQ